MAEITKLHVVKPPTVSEETKESLIALLEKALEEAKAGDISEALIVLQHADQEMWSDRSSRLTNLSTWIGRLEITKADLILKHKEADQ